MPAAPTFALVLAFAALASALPAGAEKTTICTITVNSSDEREAFRRYLPEDKFQFVELVEKGRPDWLASACQQKVQCDVLVVSGHFAGTEFYSSKPDVRETLPVDEMERVQCSDSCPGLFSRLKEVYLFGCDSLKAEPTRSAMPEIVRGLVRAGSSRADAERVARALSERQGEGNRDRMRRVFANVPLIYGFSALAPYGRTAGPMLGRYFENGPEDEVGSARPSARLLALFAPSSMIASNGMRDTEPNADYRAEACRFYDDRVSAAGRLEFIHRLLGGEMPELRMAFDRVEKFFASIGEREREDSAFSSALEEISRDRDTRGRYLATVRDTGDPAIRVRMIELASGIGWLTPAERQAELVRTIGDILAAGDVGFGEVDLICTLNQDRALDAAMHRLDAGPAPEGNAARAAALACLGSDQGRARAIRALASTDDREVQVAQAYLRHRPITDSRELRAVALGIAQMKGSGAQVRALETLARHHVSDREILDELTRLFMHTHSLSVQRAIAEVFIRSGPRAVATPELQAVLRQHRLRSPGGEDLIDVLIRNLES